uniref:TctD-like protein n=1 Tax=Trichogloeopsis pedicellata TaxID=1495610 RepID=A0A1G4P0R7_9FLOR|nr:Hypothetical protein ycf29 [Trichogloeopsis pedicellata]SCW24497.1 Hypothetical protein ycf29 [Trichogloeopsis pedicellata]
MSYTILLVDDDKSLLLSISSYLSEAGFYITSVATVAQAIDALCKQAYDLVISDILLPEKDGYDLIRYINDNRKLSNIPVIFLTAKGMTQDRILGYDLGCYGYLTKPFDPAELLSMVRNILINRETSKTGHHDKVGSMSVSYSSLLTSREYDVLNLVLKGMTNKEIALVLGLTVRTTEKYVSRLLYKTKTRNRTELAQYFYLKQAVKEKTSDRANDGNRTRE